jgi:hypothetical protein
MLPCRIIDGVKPFALKTHLVNVAVCKKIMEQKNTRPDKNLINNVTRQGPGS